MIGAFFVRTADDAAVITGLRRFVKTLALKPSTGAKVVSADGLAAVRLGALGGLLDVPVHDPIETFERIARGVAARLLNQGLCLRSHQQHLHFLGHGFLRAPGLYQKFTRVLTNPGKTSILQPSMTRFAAAYALISACCLFAAGVDAQESMNLGRPAAAPMPPMTVEYPNGQWEVHFYWGHIIPLKKATFSHDIPNEKVFDLLAGEAV